MIYFLLTHHFFFSQQKWFNFQKVCRELLQHSFLPANWKSQFIFLQNKWILSLKFLRPNIDLGCGLGFEQRKKCLFNLVKRGGKGTPRLEHIIAVVCGGVYFEVWVLLSCLEHSCWGWSLCPLHLWGFLPFHVWMQRGPVDRDLYCHFCQVCKSRDSCVLAHSALLKK